MEKLKNNILSISLISGSLLLLLLFQLFWLNRLYLEQKEWLQTTTDHLFHRSMGRVQDRVIMEWLRKAPDQEVQPAFFGRHADSIKIQIDRSTPLQIDFQGNGPEMEDGPIQKNKKVRIVTSRTSDSLTFDRTVMFTLADLTSDHFSILDLTGNTFQIDTLQNQYRRHLDTAGVALPFQMVQFAQKDSIELPAGLATSAIFAGVNSGFFYQAVFPDYQWFILRRMTPQILFSVFLLLLTALAFWFIYHSLLQQKRLLVLKNDFISNITHELKTPITTVGVAIEALSSFNALQDPKKTEEYLQISKNELKRLSLLVDKVLRTSLFEKQEPELKMECFDLRELIHEILGTMKLQFDKVSARVNFVWTGADFQLEADRMHLTSVLYNLIDNALKYSPDPPEIQIGLNSEGDNLALSVRDSGLGIPPEYKQRIFEKFFRIPEGDRHNTKGHGLGLSYVASVVKKHAGRIEVNSQLGRGSEFTITLPKASVS